MQHVGDQGNLVKNGNDQPAGGLSPAKAFFALLALLVAIGGLFLLTRPGDEPNPGPAPKSDNFALTDAEAIERFKELNSTAVEAIQKRDASLLRETFIGSSPAMERASDAIRRLQRNDVLDRSKVEIIAVTVVKNSGEAIGLRVADRLFPCFLTESGEDVSTGPNAIEGVSVWTLRLEESLWKIYDSQLQEDRVLRGHERNCP
jgi:hypothetical protein